MAKDDFLLELRDALKSALQKNNLAELKSALNKEIKKVDANLGHQKEWELFEENFNLIHSDFFVRLKSRYPELSIGELKICALLKLGLSTKEIASRLNLSTRGIETRRYRLGKKLELDRKSSLANFIKNF